MCIKGVNPLELFKLFGTIAVNTGDAEKSIDGVLREKQYLLYNPRGVYEFNEKWYRSL